MYTYMNTHTEAEKKQLRVHTHTDWKNKTHTHTHAQSEKPQHIHNLRHTHTHTHMLKNIHTQNCHNKTSVILCSGLWTCLLRCSYAHFHWYRSPITSTPLSWAAFCYGWLDLVPLKTNCLSPASVYNRAILLIIAMVSFWLSFKYWTLIIYAYFDC